MTLRGTFIPIHAANQDKCTPHVQLDAMAIYEADRQTVVAALEELGSKVWNERGAMVVSKFKSIGKMVSCK